MNIKSALPGEGVLTASRTSDRDISFIEMEIYELREKRLGCANLETFHQNYYNQR